MMAVVVCNDSDVKYVYNYCTLEPELQNEQ